MAGPSLNRPTAPRICYVVSPAGQKGGGMGRVKDYILHAGGTADLRFMALDTRGQGSAAASIKLTLAAILRIWAGALTGQVALVHVNVGDRGSFVRKAVVILASRLAGLKVVLHLHAAELVGHYTAAPAPLKRLIRWPFQAATCCVAIGQLWRSWLLWDLHIPARKIAVVYNGVPVPAAPPKPAHEVCQFLFLGNLLERKGVTDLLRALSLLPVSAPPWRAVFAGGGDIAQYQEKAAALGIGARCAFPGWLSQEESRAALREADVLVLPSYDEGLPLVILEALGSGTAVIATRVGAIGEVLQHDETVLFVKPGDPPNIAAALSRCLAEPALRGRLAAAGLALYQAHFTQERFISALFAVYRDHCGINAAAPLALAEPAP